MSITALALGAPAVAGFKLNRANEWGSTDTDIALTTGDGFELLFEGVPGGTSMLEENVAANGTGIQLAPTKVGEGAQGTINEYFAYNGCQRKLAAWFGTEVTSSLGSGGYSHLLTINEVNSAVWGTLGWTDNMWGHVIPHCKVEKLSMTFNQAAKGRLQSTILGKREFTDDSRTNTKTTLAANVTLPSQPTNRYLMLENMAVRVNAHSGGALGAGDLRYPSNVTLNFERNMKQYRTTQTGKYIAEPVAGNWKGISGEISFERTDTSADYAWIRDATELKMDIVITGSLIGGAIYYMYTFEFPMIVLNSDGRPDMNTPDLLTSSFNFTGNKARTAPTGMAFTEPRLTIQDETATNHLDNG